MYHSPMDSQSRATLSIAMSPAQPRVLVHKRRRSAAFASPVKRQQEDDASSTAESCCTTSGESSGDESDSSSFELAEEEEEEEALVAAKRRRRADLDGLKKSVRHMEAQVVDASAQLRDLAALVAQVVARRQHQ